MHRDERYIASIIFRNKIAYSEGNEFQKLFEALMYASKPEFRAVKPWGNQGDKKNDGFFEAEGIFYQVHGPENVKNPQTARRICKKIEEDFHGLLTDDWGSSYEIKQFIFVLNDKYKNIPSDVIMKITALNKENPSIKISIMSAKDLENIFNDLPEDKVVNIVGLLPSPNNITDIKYGVIDEVINHIMNMPAINYPDNYNREEFDEKIKINGLVAAKPLLESAYYQIGELEEYFSNNSKFVANDLKDRFVSLYQSAKDNFQEIMEDKGDMIFFKILEGAYPAEKQCQKNAVLVLMSYFFEACDLFEIEKE